VARGKASATSFFATETEERPEHLQRTNAAFGWLTLLYETGTTAKAVTIRALAQLRHL
jgi:hypothetical protein